MILRLLSTAIVVSALAALSSAACGRAPSAGDGAAAASADWPARTADGQPDMQGLWASGTGLSSMNIEPTEHLLSIGFPRRRGPGPGGATTGQGAEAAAKQAAARSRTLVLDPPDHILPYQPWARERRDTIMKGYMYPTPEQMDPQSRGWPNGVPRANYYTSHDGGIGGPLQILQPAGHVVFFYETHHEYRIVPLDGRPHAGQDIKLWMGDSRGHWEGNTLVVDVTNHNDSTRFTVIGDFHSDAMRITERWTFADRDTIDYKATVDDPKVFTKPWTLGMTFKRSPAGTEIMETAAVEGSTAVEEAAAIARSRAAADKQK